MRRLWPFRSAALKVALAALGVGPGDEVVTQGFTFVATWEAIFDIGAVPVFAEVDETLNMDPADLVSKITPRTKVVIPVHMMGAPARIEEIVAIATKHNLAVLEDTAQASGASLNGRKLGTFGNCGTFSFDAVKTMTTGEGGMIVTADEKLWRAMSEYQDHGHDHVVNPGGRGGEGRRFIGFNYRMMELQGAIGLAQLAKLDADIVLPQRTNKKAMKEAVSQIPGVRFRTVLDEAGDNASFLGFFLEDGARARRLNDVLKKEGCGAICFADNTWHYYPKWEHLLAGSTLAAGGWPFAEADGRRRVIYDPAALPKSAAIMERLLVLPVPVKLSAERLTQIQRACAAAVAEGV